MGGRFLSCSKHSEKKSLKKGYKNERENLAELGRIFDEALGVVLLHCWVHRRGVGPNSKFLWGKESHLNFAEKYSILSVSGCCVLSQETVQEQCAIFSILDEVCNCKLKENNEVITKFWIFSEMNTSDDLIWLTLILVAQLSTRTIKMLPCPR